jgi:hypothetical protein
MRLARVASARDGGEPMAERKSVQYEVPAALAARITELLIKDGLCVSAGDIDEDGSRWIDVESDGAWYALVIYDQPTILRTAGRL